MIKIIKSFSDIVISDKKLVICDLDDTIIHFEKITKTWWNDTRLILDENETVIKWRKLVAIEQPLMTDDKGFHDMLKQIHDNDGQIIILTARHDSITDITKMHLKKLGIDNIQIIHSQQKGDSVKYISEILYPEFKKIIFIDDMDRNLNDVYEINKDKNIELHKFEL